MNALDTKTEYVNDVLIYIAGFIFVKLKRNEQCVYCSEYLQNMPILTSSKFISAIDRGGLSLPSESFFFVVKITDGILRELMEKHIIMKQKRIVEKISLTVLDIVKDRRPSLFSSLDLHVDTSNVQSHRLALIEKISACYTTLRLRHYCKQLNATKLDKRIRKTKSKLILFENQ